MEITNALRGENKSKNGIGYYKARIIIPLARGARREWLRRRKLVQKLLPQQPTYI